MDKQREVMRKGSEGGLGVMNLEQVVKPGRGG